MMSVDIVICSDHKIPFSTTLGSVQSPFSRKRTEQPDVYREQNHWLTTFPILAGTGHMLGRSSAPSTWIRVVDFVPAQVFRTNSPLLVAADTSLVPIPVGYRDHPPTSAAHHITNNRHLLWQDLPMRAPETTTPLSPASSQAPRGANLLGQQLLQAWALAAHRVPQAADSTGSPEYPSPRGTPINRGRTLNSRYGHFCLAKTLPLPLHISILADLSIGVPTADTTPVSPSFRGASLLQVIDGGATGQYRPEYPFTLSVAAGTISGINNENQENFFFFFFFERINPGNKFFLKLSTFYFLQILSNQFINYLFAQILAMVFTFQVPK